MIILSLTTSKLQVLMGGAVTTTNPDYSISWVDIFPTTATPTFTPGWSGGALNGTTAVDVVTSPAASTYRQIKTISITNLDTVANVIIVRYNDNATLRKIIPITLGIGYTLHYEENEGWFVTDASGIRQAGAGGALTDGDKGHITVTGSGTIWEIDNGVVTLAKIVDATGQYKIMARSSASAGDWEEITGSANVFSILVAADYAAIRTLLGLVIGTNVQAYDADLDYLSTFTPTANVKSILNATDYAAIKTLLSLVIGTNVQAWDADLDYLAGFTPSANVKTILNAADYAAIRTALALVIGTNVQAFDAQLTSLAGLAYAGNALKVVSVNAGETDFELTTPAGGGDVSKVGTPVNDQVGVWTGDGTIEGTANLIFNAIGLGVGVTPAYILDILQTQNGASRFQMSNLSNGALAQVLWELTNDNVNALQIGMTSSGFTPSGLHIAVQGFIQTNQGNLLVHALGANAIKFATNSVERMRIASDGTVGIGTIDLDGAPPIGILTLKGTTNDGTTYILVGRSSDEDNVFSVDTDGKGIFAGITLSNLTGVIRADTGVLSVDANVTDIIDAASLTVAGKVELATDVETTTGTDATRAVTPDGLAGSTIFGVKSISVQVIDGATTLATGDGKAYIRVPSSLNGMNIIGVSSQVIVKSTSGTPTIQVARGRQASATDDFTYADVLSTLSTIDANEYDSKDATTAMVVNGSNDDLVTGDVLRIDVDVSGTGTKGLQVSINCQLP